jgi:hypothetical protein
VTHLSGTGPMGEHERTDRVLRGVHLQIHAGKYTDARRQSKSARARARADAQAPEFTAWLNR